MCRIGFSHGWWSMCSTAGWCDSPRPSTKRPPSAACAVSAMPARVAGCWFHVGTTVVPSVIRSVVRPASASAEAASRSPVWASQYDVNPSVSACSMSAAIAPRSGRTSLSDPLIPMRMRQPYVSAVQTRRWTLTA